MKNKRLKLYIAAFYLYSSVVLFAANVPGSANEMGDLEDGGDVSPVQATPPLPINDYLWVLALVGLIYVFIKLRNYQNDKIQS